MTSPLPPAPSRPWPVDRWFVAALLAGPVCAGALWLAGLVPPYPARDGHLDLLRLVGIMLVAPFSEEVVFRLFLQGWLGGTQIGKRRLAGLSFANLAASGVFAAAHLALHPVPWAVATFAPSLVFGHFRERHGKLISPVVLHMTYNACYVLASIFAH